jgi:hypothetical protein
MLDLYKLEGTECISSSDLDNPLYNTKETWPSFQEDFIEFKNIIFSSVSNKSPKVFLRMFDGEFYFLKGQAFGNILKRHSSINPKHIDLTPWFQSINLCDYKCTQLYEHGEDELKTFYEVFPNSKIDFPMEFLYSIIANKWVFQQFPNRIALIGGESKLKIIKKLMTYNEYRSYLGVEKFVDYVSIPETKACDYVDNLDKFFEETLPSIDADIFLFGIGISKLYLASKFKNYKNAVFLDVGAGISALAGCTSLERPYFGSWTNFRLKNFDYSNTDLMDYNDTKGLNEIYL